MLETEKGKRMEQVLATGMSREELAEVLWCTEDKLRAWNECANELRKVNSELEAENAKLRELCSELYKKYWDVEGEFFIDPEMDALEEKLRELGIEASKG